MRYQNKEKVSPLVRQLLSTSWLIVFFDCEKVAAVPPQIDSRALNVLSKEEG